MGDLWVETGEKVRLDGETGNTYLWNPAVGGRIEFIASDSYSLTVDPGGSVFIGPGADKHLHLFAFGAGNDIRSVGGDLFIQYDRSVAVDLLNGFLRVTPGGQVAVASPVADGIRLETTPGSGVATGLRLVDNRAPGRDFRIIPSDFPGGGIAGTLHIVDVANNAARITIDSAGNVGIGTTGPTVKLDVVGYIKASGSFVATTPSRGVENTDGYLLLRYAPGSGIWVDDGDSEVLMTSSAGKLGIGTMNPQEKLEVAGNFRSDGNLYALWQGSEGNFPLMWLGLDEDNLLYLFFQPRTGANGGKWAGINTFYRPPSGDPSWGYGYQPIRLYGKNALVEARGTIVSRDVRTPVLYFQKPYHRDINDSFGTFKAPTGYTNERPMLDSTELGGIYYLVESGGSATPPGTVVAGSESVSISRSGGGMGNDLTFSDITNGSINLANLVRSPTSKLRIVSGEIGPFTVAANNNHDCGTVSLSGFANTPLILLTPRRGNTYGNTWAVTVAAYEVSTSSFGVMAKNNYGDQTDFYVAWVAIGT
ncbi:MAG: hypothetical protein HYY02_13260 [Chloroflexi bacterium]|nr:hypothetical protein [Chloroflexota bacterium]